MAKNRTNKKIKQIIANKKITSESISLYFSKVDSKNLAKELIRIGGSMKPLVLGYNIVPAIFNKLIEDDQFFIDLSSILSQRSRPSRNLKMTQEFRIVALDALHSASRRRKLEGTVRKQYLNNLIDIATKEDDVPISVRTRTIRMLVNHPEQETIQTFKNIIEAKKESLVDAIGHVLVKWEQKTEEGATANYNDLLDKLIKYSEEQPSIALKSRGLINLLAKLSSPIVKPVLNKIIDEAKSIEDWNRLIPLLQKASDPEVLVRCIQEISSKINQDGFHTEYFKECIRQNPSTLDALYKQKLYKEYLNTIRLLETLPNDNAISSFIDLLTNPDNKISRLAKSAYKILPERQKREIVGKGIEIMPDLNPGTRISNKSYRFFYKAILGEKKLKEFEKTLSPSEKAVLREKRFQPNFFNASPLTLNSDSEKSDSGVLYPGKAFNYKANAIYKNLSPAIQDWFQVDDHWHAGLFLGFYPNVEEIYHSPFSGDINFYGSKPKLRGIHMNDLIYGIEIFEKSAQLDSPAGNLAAYMEQLYDQFIALFEDGDGFQGHRSTDIVFSDRRGICNTAYNLIGEVPWYTFADMLDFYRPEWNGEIDDIISMRCDGVVEYCYEKNGVKVCSGKDINKWNIAFPDAVFADNHNDFHTYDYDPGEICPRIQSGAGHGSISGDRTTFRELVIDHPIFESFYIIPEFLFIPSIIQIGVIADQSEYIYARVSVSKDGGPFYFVVADDYITNKDTPYLDTPVGPMKFMKLRKNDYVVWGGRTVDGPDYYGQEGEYEFRCVVVDESGNVSPTVFHRQQFKVGHTSGWHNVEPGHRYSDHFLPVKTIILHRLKCYSQEDLTGKDSCMLDIITDSQNFYRLEKDMEVGDVWEIGKVYQFRTSLELKLWDYDWPDPNDLLGRQIITGNFVMENLSIAFGKDDADYELIASIYVENGNASLLPKTSFREHFGCLGPGVMKKSRFQTLIQNPLLYKIGNESISIRDVINKHASQDFGRGSSGSLKEWISTHCNYWSNKTIGKEKPEMSNWEAFSEGNWKDLYNASSFELSGFQENSLSTNTDYPGSHETMDWCNNIFPSPQYSYLLAAGARHYGERDERIPYVHNEIEMGSLPIEWRPFWGEYVTLQGRLVWDIGHAPVVTEIHPYHSIIREHTTVNQLEENGPWVPVNRAIIGMGLSGGFPGYGFSVNSIEDGVQERWNREFGQIPEEIKDEREYCWVTNLKKHPLHFKIQPPNKSPSSDAQLLCKVTLCQFIGVDDFEKLDNFLEMCTEDAPGDPSSNGEGLGFRRWSGQNRFPPQQSPIIIHPDCRLQYQDDGKPNYYDVSIDLSALGDDVIPVGYYAKIECGWNKKSNEERLQRYAVVFERVEMLSFDDWAVDCEVQLYFGVNGQWKDWYHDDITERSYDHYYSFDVWTVGEQPIAIRDTGIEYDTMIESNYLDRVNLLIPGPNHFSSLKTLAIYDPNLEIVQESEDSMTFLIKGKGGDTTHRWTIKVTKEMDL
jgi:hypothetical protein